jgi:hypothetical protein
MTQPSDAHDGWISKNPLIPPDTFSGQEEGIVCSDCYSGVSGWWCENAGIFPAVIFFQYPGNNSSLSVEKVIYRVQSPSASL